jgi:voltage-gated potassium channel
MAIPDQTLAYQALDRRQRRRLVLGVLARAFGMSLGLVVVYSLLPVSSDGTGAGLVALVGGITALVAVIVYQLRRILTGKHPQLQAVEAMATVIPMFIIVFAYVYVWLSHSDPASFTQTIGRLDGVYFVVTVLTTTGFGDITAVSSMARSVVTLQMVLDLVLIGVVAKLIVGASRIGVQRRRAESAAGQTGAAADPAPIEADPLA